jgi:YD repeat-containing protein
VTIDGDSYTTGYTHDRLDRPLTIAYPDGEVVSYEYDGGGQLRRLGTNQGADYVSDTLFDGRGRLQRRVYGGVDLEDWYSYHDGSGNFLLQRHLTRRSSQPGTTYLNQEYLYNAAGDVVRWQDHGFPGSWQRRFAYDDLGRLCGASYDNQDTTQGCGHPDYEYEYRHDATGNLTFKRGMSLSYPAAGSPHPHAAQSDGSYGYEYDANGNLLVTWQGDSPVATYAWDGKNRLQSVWAGGKTVQYGYDADGRLAERVLDGLSTHYPGPHYVVEKSAGAGGGDIVTRYYLVDGQRQVLRRTGDADPGRNGRFTIHGDHLGSTSLVMNQQLQKADELRYYPFGETYAGDPGTATTDHAYTGQRWEASIGLYY